MPASIEASSSLEDPEFLGRSVSLSGSHPSEKTPHVLRDFVSNGGSVSPFREDPSLRKALTLLGS